MKKRMIKLINDERTKSTLTAQKGCVGGPVDICSWDDTADCATYAYDECHKDYSACIKGATDICTTDHASCYNPGVTDTCGVDYDLCHSAGGTDY